MTPNIKLTDIWTPDIILTDISRHLTERYLKTPDNILTNISRQILQDN